MRGRLFCCGCVCCLQEVKSLAPPPDLDCALPAVVGEEGPGGIASTGPETATEGQQAAKVDVNDARGVDQACIFATQPHAQNAKQHEVSACVAQMMEKLREFKQAGERSVAKEMEAMIDGKCTLLDERGRDVGSCRYVKRFMGLAGSFRLTIDVVRWSERRELADSVAGRSVCLVRIRKLTWRSKTRRLT